MYIFLLNFDVILFNSIGIDEINFEGVVPNASRILFPFFDFRLSFRFSVIKRESVIFESEI